jgi:hypothetical protein
MKRLIITALFLGYFETARAEELKSPNQLLVDYFAATGNSDFTKIVDTVHPSALKAFKKHTLNIVNAAVKEFSEEAVITAFQGLGSIRDLDAIPEKEFWIYVMSNLYSLRPEFDGAKSIKIIGNVEDGNSLYVLFTEDGDLKSTEQIERFLSPRAFTFRRDGERWCYWSFQVSGVEAYVQLCAKRQQSLASKPKSEQGGADQPTTAHESKSEGKDKPQPESKVAPR